MRNLHCGIHHRCSRIEWVMKESSSTPIIFLVVESACGNADRRGVDCKRLRRNHFTSRAQMRVATASSREERYMSHRVHDCAPAPIAGGSLAAIMLSGALCLAGSASGAAVVKCVDATGKVTY